MKFKQELIITHPGSAHFDEVTAVSLIVAFHADRDFVVVRREPTVEELEDPEVWVVDIGNRHEPEKRNFDHHQSIDCPAGFVLVARHLGLAEAMEVFSWWEFKDSVDRFGPVKSSEIFNAGDDLVNRNPIEMWMTRYFASDPSTALPVLKSYGRHLIENARILKRQIDFWKSCPRVDVGPVSVLIGKTRESAGLAEFERIDANPPAVVISFDRRGEGWRMFRYEGAPVDFSRIAGEEDVAFAHRTGFLAKTRGVLDIERVLELVGRSLTV